MLYLFLSSVLIFCKHIRPNWEEQAWEKMTSGNLDIYSQGKNIWEKNISNQNFPLPLQRHGYTTVWPCNIPASGIHANNLTKYYTNLDLNLCKSSKLLVMKKYIFIFLCSVSILLEMAVYIRR